MQNDPSNYPNGYSLITYVWVIMLAIWGGITHNIRKIRSGELHRFSMAEMIGDVTISGFIGVLTFWLCEYTKIDPLLGAVMIGVSSHMGARAILPMEKLFGVWLEKFSK